jgi:hypothetical protein
LCHVLASRETPNTITPTPVQRRGVIVSAKKTADRPSTIGKVRERIGYARDN